LSQLEIGMDKEKVLKTMGREEKGIVTWIPILFPLIWVPFPSYHINNPYKTEFLTVNDKQYDVIYYYTDVRKADGAITDDELTPLIFEDGKLIGWGWSFLKVKIPTYEIRIR